MDTRIVCRLYRPLGFVPESILRTAMEVFRRETEETFSRFLAQRLNFTQCLSMLDSARDSLIPNLRVEQRESFRLLILANNEQVMEEMERRGPPAKVH